MKKRRAVITGIGVLAPNGNSLVEYWDALIAGKSGIAPIQSFDAENLSVRIAANFLALTRKIIWIEKKYGNWTPFQSMPSHFSRSHFPLWLRSIGCE